LNRSLRGRLLAILSVTVLLAWLATAFFSYLDAKREIGAMLDAQLAESAVLLLALVGHAPGAEAVPALQEGPGGGVLYQVWAGERLLLRSPSAPAAPLSAAWQGYSDVVYEGARWRVFVTGDAPSGLSVQIAQSEAIRAALAESVASHLMHPLVIALPVLAVLIWLSVGWGLAPLGRLARELASREAENLEPLSARGVPREVLPLTESLNALFARITDLLERERRFTADAAHELRTPLAAIQTHAEVALAARSDEERRCALANVVRGIDRAARLVEQLLILARLDPQRAAAPADAVRLQSIAAQCIAEAASAAAEKGVDLGLVGGESEDDVIAGHADLLGILVRNLVDNAVRYSPRGGQVDVTVRREAGRLVLSVADAGIGIPPEERGRVLERFYRVLGSGEEGSGLGLSIVARVAALHDASIEFGEGLGGRGLTVRVAFPLAERASLKVPLSGAF
jgi:two-component system, OmpR family, sensor histidine kinase QseC